jgi:DNA-binding response OmpR family regulator
MNVLNKILVIDNDESFRATLAATLKEQGFQVLQSATAPTGVQMARTEFPNLILCDTDLGRVGGDLVLYAVRRDPTIRAIPFVLMSRFAIKVATPLGVERGADGFLAKPFTSGKLVATIGECLSSRNETIGSTEAKAGRRHLGGTNGSLKGMLRPLKRVIEATFRISTGHERLELQEIIGLASQAHHTASRLHKRIVESLDAEQKQ